MDTVNLTIDDQLLQVTAGTTILEAARGASIYIPTLCYHPDLPPARDSRAVQAVFQGHLKVENAMPTASGSVCGLCIVAVAGQNDLVGACATLAAEGMVITTDNERIRAKRQENLLPILTRHRHACLTCVQQDGCSRTPCSANVPENERCCPLFGHCELRSVANYIGISDFTPRWIPTDFAVIKNQPLFEKDYNLCIGCTRCVRACRELRGIEALGFVFDGQGRVQVGSLAETLADSGCKFCTACVEVCPTGALVDKSVRAGNKAEDLVACTAACPAGIDVPGYIRLIAAGKRDEAHAVIREKVPFPGVLGRICIHPCEDACRRGEVNEPLSICALKRYAADGEKGFWKNETRVAADTGRKVAVVGAGPAGLTAAFYLRKKGHAVTVFESRCQAGGMMRYGIPSYRLPRAVLAKDIQAIFDLGIEFRSSRQLGRDFTLDQLGNEGYDAVFLGVGAQLSRRIALEDCDLPDVMGGIDFLGRVAEGADVRLKDNVLVIGGGNVAIDAALTALRCGATDVSVACLECQEEMPASPWAIQRAVAEGVKIMPSWGPDKILSRGGKVTGMDLAACTCVFDEQGNFCPQFSEAKECILIDQVILALGQAADLSFLKADRRIAVDRGLIVVDQDTFATGIPGVYAGGDVTRAPSAVIHAIAAGRKAAAAIDRSLGGTGEIDEILFKRGVPDPFLGRDEGFAIWSRQKVPELEVAARKNSFDEICLGYADAQAVREARRCLQCDLRRHMGCNPVPPPNGLPFDEKHIQQVPETEGVLQLFDEDHQILAIKGTVNLRRELSTQLDENEKAAWFEFEEDKMYSRRESELIQKYLQAHGKMPGGDDGLNDLF
ncbi:MAG: FAD-dependent oxidoreductase [Desulfobacterales bacterium]|nr:MAG: FAD-dependent oxidoreductase [Desulfobacterales bacterium]